jgi:hypothetical protein
MDPKITRLTEEVMDVPYIYARVGMETELSFEESHRPL